MAGAVSEGTLEFEKDVAAAIQRESRRGKGRAGDVAAKAFESISPAVRDADGCVE